MSENLTLNAGESRTFDAGIASVQVSTGSVVITDGDDPTVVKAQDDENTHDCKGKPSLALYSPSGANLSITYAHEVETPQEPTHGVSATPEPSERGDTGGNGGSYESRTLEELHELATERKVKGRSAMDKTELIAALRGK